MIEQAFAINSDYLQQTVLELQTQVSEQEHQVSAPNLIMPKHQAVCEVQIGELESTVEKLRSEADTHKNLIIDMGQRIEARD